MKIVIFAGGMGTRISEESLLRPKPMMEIGDKPILWHIMKIFEHHGFNDFIICLGYKGYMIKEYFMNYYIHNSNMTIELNSNKVTVHNSDTESFKVTLIDTGLNTKTAGRLKRVQEYVGKEDFMLTYGDGVSNVDLHALLDQRQPLLRVRESTLGDDYRLLHLDAFDAAHERLDGRAVLQKLGAGLRPRGEHGEVRIRPQLGQISVREL